MAASLLTPHIVKVGVSVARQAVDGKIVGFGA